MFSDFITKTAYHALVLLIALYHESFTFLFQTSGLTLNKAGVCFM